MRTSETGIQKTRPTPRRHPFGFTLVEMMAVVAIMALMLTLMLPTIGATRSSALRRDANQLAASLELARQRAVMTGKPHRLVLDLEGGSYGIDWLVTGIEALGLDAPPPDPVDTSGTGPLSLSPPPTDERVFQPIPSRFGRTERLQNAIFEGVETAEGWFEAGEVFVTFDRDGTTDAADIVLSNGDDLRMSLQIRPLQEYVRVRDDDA